MILPLWLGPCNLPQMLRFASSVVQSKLVVAFSQRCYRIRHGLWLASGGSFGPESGSHRSGRRLAR